MSLPRAALVLFQAVCTQIVTTPPNKTAGSGKKLYNTDEWWILRIAPFIFALQQPFIWTCTALEVLSLFLLPSSNLPFSSELRSLFTGGLSSPPTNYISNSTLHGSVIPGASSGISHTDIQITPLFLVGSSALFLGSYIRYTCFKTLGTFFTFDLTIHKDHRLITAGPYSIVRHPSYCGSLLLVFGMPIAHLMQGGPLIELGIIQQGLGTALVWGAWWAWGWFCASRRCVAEDLEMKKLFGKEWEEYAAEVKYWFIPGLV